MVSKLSARAAHAFNTPKHKLPTKGNDPKSELFPENSLHFRL